MPKQMLHLAESHGIVIEYHSFEKPILGIYTALPDLPPIIGLDVSLRSQNSVLRCVLAEELGHYFTSVGVCITREFYQYSKRIAISRAEYRALRWAANHLIPEDDLLDILKQGLYKPWELAEHFNVTEQFAQFRLRLFESRIGA